MRRPLHLAAALLLLAAAGLRAQIVNPDKLVAPPPANPAQQPAKPTDDLQWLWPYTKPEPLGNAAELRVDARFQALLRSSFHQRQAFWGEGRQPLDAVIPLFLARYPTVTAESNRYITVDGCVPSFCPAHGLLWVDLGSPHPLVVFAAVNWTAQTHTTDQAAADYILWLFPNRELSPDALPLALSSSLAHWDARLAAAHRLVPHIAHALLVEPSGLPAALSPDLVGANTLAPQPDTVTPHEPDNN
ncbi:MAG TPA: hypothetical protein VM865_05865 [Acidobacteriaceae bacterium]|jgi:hypothetical protein|nr:hypothetical protein [Acidobacteriaceae bacterium]